MKISEIKEAFVFSFDAIRTSKLRSVLASLGVVIGISFVIIMGWILSGLDGALEDSINIFGSDMLYVEKWDWAGGRNWKKIMQRKQITLNQSNEFARRMQSAEFAIPLAVKWGIKISHNDESIGNVVLRGTRSEYGKTAAGKLVEGRFFSAVEDNNSDNVAVIGFNVNKLLFPNGGAIGSILRINGRNYQIIGISTKQGTILMDFIDNQVYVPLNSFLGMFGNTRRSMSIAIKAGSTTQMDEVRAETEGLMRIIRNLKPGMENDFSINETKAFEENVSTFRRIVWGVGIGMTTLSFIVGIIGIINIMFVSVTERTKEIGIRKAVGAPKRSILLQFLVESSSLCFIGALIAFIFCSALIYAAAKILPTFIPGLSFLSPFMPFNLLVIATIVSGVVGIIAGLIPAIRASNLDPVDSLRYE